MDQGILSKEEEEEDDDLLSPPVYDANQVDGKFKIMQEWDDALKDPNSVEYKKISEDIILGIEDLLRNAGNFSEDEVDFFVTIKGFK